MKFLCLLAFSFTAILFMADGCKKPGGGSVTGGGKGGSAVIRVTPEFANFLIDTCTVYIKYGTNDAPANGIYDDSAVCVLADTIPVATFAGLTTGLYYFYGVGYHSTGGHPPNVKGGAPYTITKEDTAVLYLPTYPYIP